MTDRSQAHEYFKAACRSSGAPEAQADAMEEDSWKFSCYTSPSGMRGPGVTYIVKKSGDVYNFGSNPLVSNVIRADSYEEFEKSLRDLCMQHGWKPGDEMSLGKVGKVGA